MKLKTIFEKNKLNKSNNSSMFILELNQTIKNLVQENRKKLNLSIAIDISGSMSSPVDFTSFNFREINSSNNKLTLVKNSVIDLINSLNDDDIVSIVAFDDLSYVVSEACSVRGSKEKIIQSIQDLKTRGSTDIQRGWLESVKQISKNIDPSFINEVIVFSDGCITSGENNLDVITKNVQSVANKDIITTTFGVGKDFNEILMQKISEYGNGNSYFISKNEDFINLLNNEFNNIINIVAKNINITFNPCKGVKIIEDFNQFAKNESTYMLPSLINKKTQELLIKFSYNSNKENILNLFDIIINYTDHNGKSKEIHYKISSETCLSTEWDSLPLNNKVLEKDILLTVAKNKEEAAEEMRKGNLENVKNILRGSSQLISSSSVSSGVIDKELDNITNLLDNTDKTDLNVFSKTLAYQSYNFKRNS